MNNEKLFTDDFVFEQVPAHATHSWINFLMIFIGMWTSLAAIGAAVNLGLGITPWKGMLGIFLGYMICMAYGWFVGNIGVRERLSTYPLLARPFSRAGASLPALFVFLIAGVFIGVQADAITRIGLSVLGIEVQSLFGPVTNRAIISLLLCSAMMFSAYKGIRYIKLISWISIPLYLSVLIVSVILAGRGYEGGLGALFKVEKTDLSFAYSMFLGVSLYAGFSALLPDVSRFVKNRGHFSVAVVMGYVLASFIPISGIVFGAALGVEYWEAFSMYGLAFGFYATISLFMAQWTTNDNNAFASGLALSTFFNLLHEKVKWMPALTRRQATLVPIGMGIVMAALGAGATRPLLTALGALGSWLPTIAGVFIGHYYVVEKINKKEVQSRGIAGLLSWIVISFLVQFGKLPWTAITGVVGAIVLYVILYYAIEYPIWGKKQS